MKMYSLRGGVAAGLILLTSLASSCVPPGTKATTSNSLLSTTTQSNDDGKFQVQPAGTKFSLTGPISAAINLGAKSTQTYTLHTGAYSGTIKLTVEDDEVQAVDKKSQIAFTVSPSTIAIAPNSNYTFTVNIATASTAPDLALHYHVFARDAAGSVRNESGMQTDFAVNPILEITIGAGNAKNTVLWSTDLINAGTGIAAKQDVSIVAHAGGVTVKFINMDPKGPHIIHGAGLIPHQNTAVSIRSLASGAVNPAGRTYVDSYDVKVTSLTAGGSGTYYLHDAESGAKAGKVIFNANAASVKPPVVDPLATFAKMNSTILQSKCVGCHNAGNSQGGIDLSSFTAVLKQAVPFDFASSALYTAILANMPLGGTPLSATDKDLVKNWINNGALNN